MAAALDSEMIELTGLDIDRDMLKNAEFLCGNRVKFIEGNGSSIAESQ